jgi:hypothetical protein
MIIGAFTEMDALALFMIELQAANRKLHKIFDVSDGMFNEQRAHRMSNGLESAACLTHIKASWDVRKQEAREGHAVRVLTSRPVDLPTQLPGTILFYVLGAVSAT